jgi:hypothetical protein
LASFEAQRVSVWAYFLQVLKDPLPVLCVGQVGVYYLALELLAEEIALGSTVVPPPQLLYHLVFEKGAEVSHVGLLPHDTVQHMSEVSLGLLYIMIVKLLFVVGWKQYYKEHVFIFLAKSLIEVWNARRQPELSGSLSPRGRYPMEVLTTGIYKSKFTLPIAAKRS